jgi:hypothetical protein
MKKNILFLIILCCLWATCKKKHKYTLKLPSCNENIYIEQFNVNPAGVDADYLTDSLNFRVYVGKWDNEHEFFSYVCMGDSILIKKIDITGEFETPPAQMFSLEKLKQQKNVKSYFLTQIQDIGM